jgi:hypothetical protein
MENFTTRFWSKVDKTEACWNWTGHLIKNGYGRIVREGKQTVAHRASYEHFVSPIPAGMDIDHICHNRACVNPEHLRPVTRKQNCENLTGAYRNSKSGVRGVTQRKNRWRATVSHHGKVIYLGTYDTVEDANEVATAKRLELFTHSDMDRVA